MLYRTCVQHRQTPTGPYVTSVEGVVMNFLRQMTSKPYLTSVCGLVKGVGGRGFNEAPKRLSMELCCIRDHKNVVRQIA
jgi:hypothetical protein